MSGFVRADTKHATVRTRHPFVVRAMSVIGQVSAVVWYDIRPLRRVQGVDGANDIGGEFFML
jgi:hypothetical protein